MTNRTIIDEAVIYVVTVGEVGPAGPAGGGGGGGGPVNAVDVVVTPSGNLTSINAQAALVELQLDIDNRALASHNHAGVYQPLDGDLTSISGLSGTGFLKRAGVDSWVLDSSAYALASHDHAGVYQPLDADLTAIAALAGSSGILTKTAPNTWALDTNVYALASHDHAGVYQPLDADLTAIAALGFSATAFLKKTALDTWVLDTTVYAPLNSPTFTGTPAGPTAAVDTNTTQLATTAFVIGQGYLKSAAAAAAYQPLDGDLTAIAALAGTGGILTKIGVNTWSLDTNTYALASHTHTGVYEPAYSAGTTGQAWRGDKTWQSIPTILGYTPVNRAGDSGLGTMVFDAAAEIYKPGTASQFFIGSTNDVSTGAGLKLHGGTWGVIYDAGAWELFTGQGGTSYCLRGSPAGSLDFNGTIFAWASYGLDANALGTGTVPIARIGTTGTRNSSAFYRGDDSWSNAIVGPFYFGVPGLYYSLLDDNILLFANNSATITPSDTTGWIDIHAGSNGAQLFMTGRDYASPGTFSLVANDGTNTASLSGIPTGLLSWSGAFEFWTYLYSGYSDARMALGAAPFTHKAFYANPTFTDTSQNLSTFYSGATVNDNNNDFTHFHGALLLVAAGKTVSTVYGFRANEAIGSGTITTQYGVYVPSLTKGATNYAVWTGGTTPSIFGGQVSVLNAVSTVSTGTAPYACTSTTLNTNLNADLLDGQHGSYYQNASNLNAGTLPDARFPATLPAASGVNLTNLNASNLASGTVPTARLGSGTANNTTFYRGDQTFTNVLNGSLGLVTTPFAWGGVVPYALNVRHVSLAAHSGSVNAYIAANVYYDGSTWKYINTGEAGVLAITAVTGGVSYTFYSAVSASAGSSATLVTNASLSAAGDFSAITVSPGALANWYLGQSGSNPYINLDSGDYISYNRSTNRLTVNIGGTDYFYVDDSDIVWCKNGVDSQGPITTNSSSGMTAPKFVSTVATGTQPYACTSTTLNTNLNAQYVNGYATSESTAASSVACRTSAGYLFAVYFNMSAGDETSTGDRYIFMNGTDGYFRRKTLANVKTEIVTAAAVNTAIGGLSTVNFKQNVNLVSDVGGAGTLYSTSVRDSTTANAANMVIDGTGGYIQRSTSSARYKRNIQNATHGLAQVLQLRPVTYQGKGPLDGDKVHGGLISEEVHAVGLSEFVTYRGNLPDGLAYGNMVSLLVKALQEEHAITQALEARVALLEAA